MMNYRKRVPNVPTRSQSNGDSGNADFTPIEGANVPNVPNVPREVEIRIQESVCVRTSEPEKHTHHTNVCKGGVHVSESGNVGTLANLQVVERVPSSVNVWERKVGTRGNIDQQNHYVTHIEGLLMRAIRQNISFRFVAGHIETDETGELVDTIVQEHSDNPCAVASIMTKFDARYRMVLSAMQQPGVYSDKAKANLTMMAKSVGIDLKWNQIPFGGIQAVQP